jgi:hypothetical protein
VMVDTVGRMVSIFLPQEKRKRKNRVREFLFI